MQKSGGKFFVFCKSVARFFYSLFLKQMELQSPGRSSAVEDDELLSAINSQSNKPVSRSGDEADCNNDSSDTSGPDSDSEISNCSFIDTPHCEFLMHVCMSLDYLQFNVF